VRATSFGTVIPVSSESNATQEIERLITQVKRRLDELRKAHELVSGQKAADPSAAEDEPQDKPEAITRVLRLSGQSDLSAMAIWGAMDTRGWLTDKDYEDDKHFYKTLQKMAESGRLVKPRRGQYALPERVPQTYGDPALDLAANGHGGVVQEDFLEQT
jgi:hypothetical protein